MSTLVRTSRPARRVGGAVRGERGDHRPLVRVHVRDARHGDAGRLDDVDGVDADAGPELARRRRHVPRHVERDDGGDDAAVLAAHAVRYRRGRGRGARPRLTTLVAAGYFSVWTLCGVAVYPLGLALAAAEMRVRPWRAPCPCAVGVVV